MYIFAYLLIGAITMGFCLEPLAKISERRAAAAKSKKELVKIRLGSNLAKILIALFWPIVALIRLFA